MKSRYYKIGKEWFWLEGCDVVHGPFSSRKKAKADFGRCYVPPKRLVLKATGGIL